MHNKRWDWCYDNADKDSTGRIRGEITHGVFAYLRLIRTKASRSVPEEVVDGEGDEILAVAEAEEKILMMKQGIKLRNY